MAANISQRQITRNYRILEIRTKILSMINFWKIKMNSNLNPINLSFLPSNYRKYENKKNILNKISISKMQYENITEQMIQGFQ